MSSASPGLLDAAIGEMHKQLRSSSTSSSSNFPSLVSTPSRSDTGFRDRLPRLPPRPNSLFFGGRSSLNPLLRYRNSDTLNDILPLQQRVESKEKKMDSNDVAKNKLKEKEEVVNNALKPQLSVPRSDNISNERKRLNREGTMTLRDQEYFRGLLVLQGVFRRMATLWFSRTFRRWLLLPRKKPFTPFKSSHLEKMKIVHAVSAIRSFHSKRKARYFAFWVRIVFNSREKELLQLKKIASMQNIATLMRRLMHRARWQAFSWWLRKTKSITQRKTAAYMFVSLFLRKKIDLKAHYFQTWNKFSAQKQSESKIRREKLERILSILYNAEQHNFHVMIHRGFNCWIDYYNKYRFSAQILNALEEINQRQVTANLHCAFFIWLQKLKKGVQSEFARTKRLKAHATIRSCAARRYSFHLSVAWAKWKQVSFREHKMENGIYKVHNIVKFWMRSQLWKKFHYWKMICINEEWNERDIEQATQKISSVVTIACKHWKNLSLTKAFHAFVANTLRMKRTEDSRIFKDHARRKAVLEMRRVIVHFCYRRKAKSFLTWTKHVGLKKHDSMKREKEVRHFVRLFCQIASQKEISMLHRAWLSLCVHKHKMNSKMDWEEFELNREEQNKVYEKEAKVYNKKIREKVLRSVDRALRHWIRRRKAVGFEKWLLCSNLLWHERQKRNTAARRILNYLRRSLLILEHRYIARAWNSWHVFTMRGRLTDSFHQVLIHAKHNLEKRKEKVLHSVDRALRHWMRRRKAAGFEQWVDHCNLVKLICDERERGLSRMLHSLHRAMARWQLMKLGKGWNAWFAHTLKIQQHSDRVSLVKMKQLVRANRKKDRLDHVNLTKQRVLNTINRVLCHWIYRRKARGFETWILHCERVVMYSNARDAAARRIYNHLRTAVMVWEHQSLSRGWNSFCAQTQRSKLTHAHVEIANHVQGYQQESRKKVLHSVDRALRHWIRRRKARGFEQWLFHCSDAKFSRNQKEKALFHIVQGLHRAVERWKHMKLLEGWSAWYSYTLRHGRHFDWLLQMKSMRRQTLHSVFRILANFRYRRMAAVFDIWLSHCDDVQRIRDEKEDAIRRIFHMQHRAMKRWKHRVLARRWTAWYVYTLRLARLGDAEYLILQSQRKVLHGVFRIMAYHRYRHLAAGFDAWLSHCEDIQRVKDKKEKALFRMVHGLHLAMEYRKQIRLGYAWNKWCHFVQMMLLRSREIETRASHFMHVCHLIVCHWQHRKMFCGFRKWISYCTIKRHFFVEDEWSRKMASIELNALKLISARERDQAATRLFYAIILNHSKTVSKAFSSWRIVTMFSRCSPDLTRKDKMLKVIHYLNYSLEHGLCKIALQKWTELSNRQKELQRDLDKGTGDETEKWKNSVEMVAEELKRIQRRHDTVASDLAASLVEVDELESDLAATFPQKFRNYEGVESSSTFYEKSENSFRLSRNRRRTNNFGTRYSQFDPKPSGLNLKKQLVKGYLRQKRRFTSYKDKDKDELFKENV